VTLTERMKSYEKACVLEYIERAGSMRGAAKLAGRNRTAFIYVCNRHGIISPVRQKYTRRGRF
jgi:hypothetical protein